MIDVRVAAVPWWIPVSAPVPAVWPLLRWYRRQGSAGGSLTTAVTPPVTSPLSPLITKSELTHYQNRVEGFLSLLGLSKTLNSKAISDLQTTQ